MLEAQNKTQTGLGEWMDEWMDGVWADVLESEHPN